MPIQYAGGTSIYTTFVASTRQQIVTNISTNLLACGWTVVSGGGSGGDGVSGLPESSHPYPGNYDNTWTYTLGGLSTGSIDVTFDPLCQTENGYDLIYVMDGTDVNISGSPFSGSQLSGVTKNVPGNTVKIRLTSDGSVSFYGFKVTHITQAAVSNSSVTLQSALSPQNLQCRVRVMDSGSGNCATVVFYNPTQTRSSLSHWLLPGADKIYHMACNQYQFFVWCNTLTTRDFVAGGVPYLPSFLNGSVYECIWSQSNGRGDNDGTYLTSFRNYTYASSGDWSNHAWCWCDVNGTNWNSSSYPNNGSLTHPGMQGLLTQRHSNFFVQDLEYLNNGWMVYEPLIGWGTTNYDDEWKIRGQLWDAIMIGRAYETDQTQTFDSRTWVALQNVHSGWQYNGEDRATLMLYTP